MLTKPAIADETIRACLRDNHGLIIAAVTFLPLGADYNSAVYRVVATDDTPYFLKLRRADFDEMAVAVPALLHASGARLVMVPIPTSVGRLWLNAHGFDWTLYPFMEGKNGYEVALSDPQLVALGACLKVIHTTTLPAELAARLPREIYSPRLRELVRVYDKQMDQAAYADPTAASLAEFWLEQRAEIRLIVARAEELARLLQDKAVEFVVCHSDLHAGNLLLGADEAIAIVDWDNPSLGPKEHDLMFVGAGLNGEWHNPREAELFYRGYGETVIDAQALAYYHYERIIADIASFAVQILGLQGGAEDRTQALRWLKGSFGPGEAVTIAHRLYPL